MFKVNIPAASHNAARSNNEECTLNCFQWGSKSFVGCPGDGFLHELGEKGTRCQTEWQQQTKIRPSLVSGRVEKLLR